MNFFVLNLNLIWPWSIFKKNLFFSLDFCKKLQCSNIFAMTEHTWNQFFSVHFDPFRWVPWWFSKFQHFFIAENCILIRRFGILYENYSMRWLNIRGNDFIACWDYAERIFAYSMLSKRTNFDIFYMDQTHAEPSRKPLHLSTFPHISQRGNDKKFNISVESRTIFKNLVLQALGTLRIRFVQKEF